MNSNWGFVKYYQLMFDYENYDDATCLESIEMHGIDEYIFEQAIEITDWNKFIFHYDSGKTNSFIDSQGNDLNWLVVSQQLKKLFGEYKSDGIQFLPVEIKNQNDENLSAEYCAVNIFNPLEGAFNYEKTEYIGLKPPIEKVEFEPPQFYALNQKAIEGQDVFKVKECPVPIFVSDKFKNAVSKNSITGIDFKKTIIV